MRHHLSLWRGEVAVRETMGEVAHRILVGIPVARRATLEEVRAPGRGPRRVVDARRAVCTALAEEGYLQKQVAGYLCRSPGRVSHMLSGGWSPEREE